MKIRENLRQLLVLKQTVPILQTLISSSGNFSVALDLIANAENVSKNLKLEISETISGQLKSLKTDCAKKLESESLKLFQNWLESQIVISDFPKVSEKASMFTMEPIEVDWFFPTVNLNPVRLQQLIVSMLRTNEIDQFLRQLKVFSLQHAKKLYAQLVD